MLPADFAIKNVNVWNEDKVEKNVDVLVASGWVEEIISTGNRSLPETVFDGSAMVLVPSGVDFQVHIRTPGQYHKETPWHAAKAALKGGYGCLLAMPNTFPAVDSPEILKRCYEEFKVVNDKLGVSILQSAAVSVGLKGLELAPLEDLVRAGACAYTDDGVPIINDDLMLAAFRASQRFQIPVLQHAEWPGHGGVLSKCSVQSRMGLSEYPLDSESRCVERDLKLLKQVPGARYHVLHVTTKRSLELIAEAKKEGLCVTCEVSPHHLFFCAEDIQENNTSFKMNPPLFRDEDRKALRDGLRSKLVDFVATDHAPHEEYGKSRGMALAPFGTTGLETSFRVLLYMLELGFLKKPEDVVRVFSSAPTRMLGLETQGWGCIRPGVPLRAGLWDIDCKPQVVSEAELESLSKNNIFVGTPLPGRLKAHFNPAGVFRF